MNKNYNKNQALAKYRQYEKLSGKNIAGLKSYEIASFAGLVMTPFLTFAFYVLFRYGMNDFMPIFLVGTVISYVVSFVRYFIIKKKRNVEGIKKTLCYEGYSEKLIAECEKISEKDALYKPLYLATLNMFNGNIDTAVQQIMLINESMFQTKPYVAQRYYAVRLQIFLLKGDMQMADNTYNTSMYYMRTYMNSPVYGAEICLAFAMYEFFKCNYNQSIQLVEQAVNIADKNSTNEYKFKQEHAKCMCMYWKAMNFACMGNKAVAWDLLNCTRNLYTTPYYRECINKLFADMANNK